MAKNLPRFRNLLLCLVLSALWTGEGFAQESPECSIRSIDLKSTSRADLIVVKSTVPIESWHDFILKKPDRVVIDLDGCQCPGKLTLGRKEGQVIGELRFARHPKKIRIAANIKDDTEIQRTVRQEGNTLEIYIERSGAPGEEQSAQSEWKESEPAESPKPLQEKSAAESFFNKGGELEPLKPFGQEGGFGKEPAGGLEKPPWEKETLEKGSAFEFSGYFRNLLAHDTQEDNEFEDDMYHHAELRLEAKYVLNPQIYAVLGVDLNHFAYGNDGDWDGDSDIRFWNAYFSVAGTHYSLKVGNQIVKWGKSDEIGPIDVINPEDYRDGFIRTRAERKVPIPMVNMELYKGMYRLQGLFIPIFYKSNLDLEGRDWALFDHFQEEIGYFQVEDQDYPTNLENSGVGVRFSGTVSNFDYAFDYLHIRDTLPSVGSLTVPAGFPLPFPSGSLKDLAQFAQMTGQPVVLEYVRQDIFGFEFETTWRDFGLRGEAAYTNPRSFITNELTNVEKSVFQYVLGADYRGPESFYCNLQFSQAVILDYDDRILFFDEVTNTVYGTVTKGILDENVELGFRGYYNFTNEDFFYNPNILLKYWQNVTFELGLEFVGGPADTTLGVFQDNDEVYGILRWFF
jgi:hypothetical protein